MTLTELWLTYHQISRGNKPATAQLIELEFQNHKLLDLEDVLDHVFRQGFVEPKHRPVSWWEKKDGSKIKASQIVEELLNQGIGKCQQTALKLVIADVPPALWFSYIHLHHPTENVVSQRIKFDTPGAKFERLAHVTNYIFNEGFLVPRLRSSVYWEGVCGKRIEEDIILVELLTSGEGVSEDKPLRLIIDHPPVTCHPSPPTCPRRNAGCY